MNEKPRCRVLKPYEFCGDVNGDYGYEIDGMKSKNSYVSDSGARKAMHRALEKLETDNTDLEKVQRVIKSSKAKMNKARQELRDAERTYRNALILKDEIQNS